MGQSHISNKQQPQRSKQIYHMSVQSKTATDLKEQQVQKIWGRNMFTPVGMCSKPERCPQVQCGVETGRYVGRFTLSAWGLQHSLWAEKARGVFGYRSVTACLMLKKKIIYISRMECSRTREYAGRSVKISIIQGKDNRGSLCVCVFWICVFAFCFLYKLVG